MMEAFNTGIAIAWIVLGIVAIGCAIDAVVRSVQDRNRNRRYK